MSETSRTGGAADGADSIAAEVKKLRGEIASIQKMLAKLAAEAEHDAAKVAEGIGEVAGEMASAATAQAKTFASELESATRKNPLGTLGVTLLVGMVIGMMSRGRN